ncbi:MAG: S1 family peptidase [Mucilaginibacter sp.]
MRKSFFMALSLCLLLFRNVSAQNVSTEKWQKAVVKIESIQQRYNMDQVDVLLHKQIDTLKGLSQHDKYERQGQLLTIKDTIRGTGLLIADGDKVYLVTAKHLIKATENNGTEKESINDLISIRVNVNGKVSNDVSLMNLSTNQLNIRPFVFSADNVDLGIISFQKPGYKPILNYLKQMGCVPIQLQSIEKSVIVSSGDQISLIGFPAVPGKGLNSAIIERGKIDKESSGSFTVTASVYPGNSGSPVIKTGKLIGILSYQTGIKNNIDAALHPYQQANSATAINISQLLPLLRVLQVNEKNAAFKQ